MQKLNQQKKAKRDKQKVKRQKNSLKNVIIKLKKSALYRNGL